MTQNYDGATVFDGTDEKVGTVERTYVDDSDMVRFVAVRTGTILHKHRLIPTDTGTIDDEGLHLPYSKDAIDEGPTIDSPDDTLEGDILRQTREYYGGSADGSNVATENASNQSSEPVGARSVTDSDSDDDEVVRQDVPTVPAASGETVESLGQIREKGDIVEVPIVEERLVRQPVVTEVVRVKKTRYTDTSTAAADVRKEAVEVDADEGISVGGTRETDES